MKDAVIVFSFSICEFKSQKSLKVKYNICKNGTHIQENRFDKHQNDWNG